MLPGDLKGWKVILASSSPRRVELMKNLGLEFSQISIDFDEFFPDNMSNEETAYFLADKKANHVIDSLRENELGICADTIVCHKNTILGKPGTGDEAKKMLEILSGDRHMVLTGVCIFTREERACFVSSTEVVFSQLSREEIDYYIDKYKPYDKAGAYGIQEWIGYIGVEEIIGSYFNVMGLPVQKLYKELKKFIDTHKIK